MEEIPEIYFPALKDSLKKEVIEECGKEKIDLVIDKYMPILNIETFTRYLIMNRKKLNAGHTGFTELLLSLDSGFRQVCELIKRFNITEKFIYGIEKSQCDITTQIEHTIVNMLMTTNCLFYIISAAREEVISIKPCRQARYILAIDPIDGLANISSNFPMATTFAIYRPNQVKDNYKDTLHCCGEKSIIVGGYVIYGAATVLVIAFNAIRKVQEYMFDPIMGEFLLVKSGVRIPDKGDICCVDNAKRHLWLVEQLTSFVPQTYANIKHTGSFVTNFHIILKNGGVLVEPPLLNDPQAELQIITKLTPLAFICKIAGGISYGGYTLSENILRIRPKRLHETSPFLMGSPLVMRAWNRLLAGKFDGEQECVEYKVVDPAESEKKRERSCKT
ncbi:hypothetical protein O3M35_008017 [Rhynocoris fuscipes]|uniref:fructose-bisphosphatase n=1 Tax=Rhynocoris fuscipes TaxID=488301 RepID=A0AAW1D4R1_9HEMI